MRKIVVWVLMSAMGVTVANAAVVLQLGLNDRDKSSVTWEFSGLDADVVINKGNPDRGVKLTENTLSGAAGSFSLTLSAAQAIDHLDPASWTFGPATAVIHGWNSMGWGVCSPGDVRGYLRLNRGEAFLLRFDVSNLTLKAGNVLVFSVLMNQEMSYRIYRRTDRSSGMLVESISFEHPGFSPRVVVGDSVEFAITDAGYEGVVSTSFMKEFSLDVVSEKELGLRPVTKKIVKAVAVDKGSSRGNQVISKRSSVLEPEEVLGKANVSASPEIEDEAESPTSVVQFAIVFVVCIIILIPGIMVVVKVIS